MLEAIKVYPDGREVIDATLVAGKREYLDRLYEMCRRQKGMCAMCGRYITSEPTFDHQVGRGLSGSHRDDRIEIDGAWHNAALCWGCNAEKSSKRYEWREGKYVPARKFGVAEVRATSEEQQICAN